jgi:hypothetical protein
MTFMRTQKTILILCVFALLLAAGFVLNGMLRVAAVNAKDDVPASEFVVVWSPRGNLG